MTGVAGHAAKSLLTVNGLGKSFRGLKALSNVNLEVRQGEILGLLGPNGSGKSTFINVVSGHFLPDGGEVWLDGRNIAGLPAHEIARAGIARTYQIPRPFSQMSVLDNVAVAAMYAGQGLPHHGSRAGARRMQWLEFTHLAAKAHEPAGRAEPAPAQVPGTGARAGLAAASWCCWTRCCADSRRPRSSRPWSRSGASATRAPPSSSSST